MAKVENAGSWAMRIAHEAFLKKGIVGSNPTEGHHFLTFFFLYLLHDGTSKWRDDARGNREQRTDREGSSHVRKDDE